jgi:16S rRNA (uracil1498-N3)-methyltransferase
VSQQKNLPDRHRWRFFVAPGSLVPGSMVLDASESHFAVVLRLRPGEPIEVGDGAGFVAAGHVGSVTKEQVTVVLESPTPCQRPSVSVTVVLARARTAALEEVVESVVQLGATRVVIFDGGARHRSEEALALKDREIQRLQRIALESCRVAKRAWLCDLDLGLRSAHEVLDLAKRQASVVCVCDEAPLHEAWTQPSAQHPHLVDAVEEALKHQRSTGQTLRDIMVIIGPESGLPETIKRELRDGAKSSSLPLSFVTLGDGILTVPNAARAAVVLAQHAARLVSRSFRQETQG